MCEACSGTVLSATLAEGFRLALIGCPVSTGQEAGRTACSAVTPDIPESFPENARWPGFEELRQQLRAAFAAHPRAETKVLLSIPDKTGHFRGVIGGVPRSGRVVSPQVLT